MALKHFGMDIHASSGGMSASETYEALGAFLLWHADYPIRMPVREITPDEIFEFDYSGRTWRFQFILVHNMATNAKEAFRIHFDYIREA